MPGANEADVNRTVNLIPHATPGVLQKSLDLLDCKGVDFFGDDKEFVTV
jgi:hypothetical protein